MNITRVVKFAVFVIIMLTGISLMGVGIPSLIKSQNTSGAEYDSNIKNGLAYTISGVVLFLIGYKLF